MTRPVRVPPLMRLHCRGQGQDQSHNLPLCSSVEKRGVAGPSIYRVLAVLQHKFMNKKLEVTQVNRFHVIELDRPEVLGWLVWEIKSAERVARVRDKGVWPPSLCSQFFHASLHLAATGRGAVGSSRPTTRKRGHVGWPPYCSPPFMKRPPIVPHAESDPRGRTELPGLCAER